jgi:hypothetical protein
MKTILEPTAAFPAFFSLHLLLVSLKSFIRVIILVFRRIFGSNGWRFFSRTDQLPMDHINHCSNQLVF